jgi:cobalt-zinc-cadmium efflux system outer membrane protein
MRVCAQSAPDSGPLKPEELTLDTAVRFALQNNPELATLRQQHGIAAAAVVIAYTYPYNPVWEAKVRATTGPASAGITNAVSNEHKVFMDVEIRGQHKFRKQGACAALSRTDAEIAYQEQLMAVRVIRAYNTLLYRQQKLKLLEETVQLNERTVEQALELRQANRITAADLTVARSEVVNAKAILGTGRAAVNTALYDLRRLLGLVDQPVAIKGTLETSPRAWEKAPLTDMALGQRADLRARQAAIAEAEARLRLQIADRWGNPNFGPAFEYDPTRVTLIGAQFTIPLGIFNRHRGEILQREAERTRAALDLRQVEITIRIDVEAALKRLETARAWAKSYQTDALPQLQKSLQEMKVLFSEAAVDVLRVIDINRKILTARDSYLDALWEVSQAEADLAAAAGDPFLVIAPF